MKNTVKIIYVFILSIITVPALSQSWSSVKSDPKYLWGEGYGNTVAEADKAALADLISKISLQIDNKTFQIEEETTKNGALSSTSSFKQNINTYSQATLNNTDKITITNEPDAHVGRWIKRSEISKIFESRKQKIRDMVELAKNAESAGKVDDALRNYYWAFSLLRSVQYPNEMTIMDDNGKKRTLMTWIPECMNNIFTNIKTSVIKKDGDEVELLITYKNKPVSSVDYTYFDGRDWSNIYSAKDGRGVLELAPGNVSSQYQIKYEYEYRGESSLDREIESVLGIMSSKVMKMAYDNVESDISVEDLAFSHKMATSNDINNTFSTNTENNISVTPLSAATVGTYADAVNKIIAALKNRNYALANDCFSKQGLDIYNRLICYGKAKIVGEPNITFYDFDDGVVARGLQLAFSFKTGMRKSFVEDVVFTFNKAKKVDNISFGLGKTAENDILHRGTWDESVRKTIMNFLENYKTAYALKRLDYIETIFDDNAVIIVANVAKKSTLNRTGDGSAFIKNNNIIRHNRYTKDKYLKNLATCFQRNEFINIRFANNDIRRMGKGGELYAIQVAQDYCSSSYCDKGYLFLEVDFNDKNQPLIILRTWQPEPDPDFGLYGPEDF